jgi:hypothetical protein
MPLQLPSPFTQQGPRSTLTPFSITQPVARTPLYNPDIALSNAQAMAQFQLQQLKGRQASDLLAQRFGLIDPYLQQFAGQFGGGPQLGQFDPNNPAFLATKAAIEQRGLATQENIAAQMARAGTFRSGVNLAAQAKAEGETQAQVGLAAGGFAQAAQQAAINQYLGELQAASGVLTGLISGL